MADFQITGAEETKFAMSLLPKKVQAAITRKGMTLAGRIVRAKAIELCPVITGTLRGSIVARRPAGAKRGEIRREVAATAPYAHVVELGHHTPKNNVKPHPFLAPALNRSAAEIKDVIAQAVYDGAIGALSKQE